jgi:hypothetical protein
MGYSEIWMTLRLIAPLWAMAPVLAYTFVMGLPVPRRAAVCY